MKVFRNIISLTLVLSIFNVIVGRMIHEVLEHSHEIHECELKGTVHFHKSEINHPDFICDFNFSTSLLTDAVKGFNEFLLYQENKVKIHFLWLAKNLCVNLISLRGPPNSFSSTIIFNSSI